MFGETWQLHQLTSKLCGTGIAYTPHNGGFATYVLYTSGIRVTTPTGAMVSVQTGPAAGTSFAETMVLQASDGTFCENHADAGGDDDVVRWGSPEELFDELSGDIPK